MGGGMGGGLGGGMGAPMGGPMGGGFAPLGVPPSAAFAAPAQSHQGTAPLPTMASVANKAPAAPARAPASSAAGDLGLGDLVLSDPSFYHSMERAAPPGFNPLATPLASPGGMQQQLQQQVHSMYASTTH